MTTRSRTGSRCLGIVAAGMLAASGALPGAAGAQAPAVTFHEAAPTLERLAAGPDGGMWGVARHRDHPGLLAVRYDADGDLSSATPLWTPSRTFNRVLSGPMPLADGGVGVVVARAVGADGPIEDAALARLAPGGAKVRFTTLPAQARHARLYATAADGALWFASPSTGAAYRLGTDGGMLRARLPARGGPWTADPSDTALVIDAEGAAWVALGGRRPRVSRVRADGQVRTWRLPEAGSGVAAPRLVAAPRTADVALQGGSWRPYVARLRADGMPVRVGVPSTSHPAVAVDGEARMWLTQDGDEDAGAQPGLRWQSRTGETGSVAFGEGRAGLALTIGRDGAPWALVGREGYAVDPYWSGYLDLSVVRAGTGERIALPEAVVSTYEPTPLITLGPDGALWAKVRRSRSNSDWAVARVLPQTGEATTRAPRATAVRAVVRTGATAWLQVDCDADRGRFCRGTARLGGGATTSYVLAGQTRGTVPAALDARARRTLRARRSVRVAARVTSVGARATGATVTVRR